jgi:integrase
VHLGLSRRGEATTPGIPHDNHDKHRHGGQDEASHRCIFAPLRDHRSDSLLFPAEGGGLLPATTFYKHWRRARHLVGHDELHLHDLRHAAGTLAAGLDVILRGLEKSDAR